jgi:hypothetical protein
MQTHKIFLLPAGKDRAEMFYREQMIGVSHQPVHEAARWLLAGKLAAPLDRIETYRGKTLCLSAPVGHAATLSIKPSTLRLYRYRAFDPYIPAQRRLPVAREPLDAF